VGECLWKPQFYYLHLSNANKTVMKSQTKMFLALSADEDRNLYVLRDPQLVQRGGQKKSFSSFPPTHLMKRIWIKNE